MDKQQKDRLDELQQYNIPAVKYFWVSGPEIAIHKGFLKYYTFTVLIAGIILTLLTEHTPFWFILGSGFWNLAFAKGWYVTLPAIGIGLLYLYIRDGRNKKRKIEQLKSEARRRKIDELIG
jgi:hypothetical protein